MIVERSLRPVLSSVKGNGNALRTALEIKRRPVARPS
jgi:hypothetical protein